MSESTTSTAPEQAQHTNERERPNYWLHYGGSHAALIAPDGTTLLRVPQGELARKNNALPDPPTPDELSSLTWLLNDRLDLLNALRDLRNDCCELRAVRNLDSYSRATAAIAKAEGGR